MRDMDNLMRASRQSQRMRTPVPLAKTKQEVREYTDMELRPRSPAADGHGDFTPVSLWRERPTFDFPSPSGASDCGTWFGEPYSDDGGEVGGVEDDAVGRMSDHEDYDTEELMFNLDT